MSHLKKKEYEKASAHAQKAYALGFPLPGLKNKLKAAGKWREPEPAPAVVEAKEAPKAAESEAPAAVPVEPPSGE